MKTLPSRAYSVRPPIFQADGGEQLVAGGDRPVAGVHQQEAAGAVGVLGHARARGRPGRRGPPAGRRPRRRSGPAAPSSAGERLAVDLAGGAHLRQHRARDVAESPAARRPSRPVWMFEEQGARGVGDVGHVERRRRSASRSARSRRCRRRARRLRRCRGRRGRGRASRRAWCRRSRRRAPGRSARGRAARAPRASAGRRRRRCAGPARRWRWRSAGRSRGPRGPWSRAGW